MTVPLDALRPWAIVTQTGAQDSFLRKQIAPGRVGGFDERDLLRTPPALELFLARDGGVDVLR